MAEAAVTVQPATPERWPDVERVFRGCADAGRCWCAYWYLPNRNFKAGWGEANRDVLRDRVLGGLEPGVLAYAGDDPPAGPASLLGPTSTGCAARSDVARAGVDWTPADRVGPIITSVA